MQKILGIGLVMLMFVGCASAQTSAPIAPAGPKTISTSSDVDDVLDALDARGKNLSDFTADVSLTDVDNANGTDSTLAGKIWMQKLPGDDARLRVTFDKKITNGKEKADKSEYTLDKGWLIDRKYADRQEIRRQVLKPGQKMNLLKLGEGPFPLPLGQDKADVHRLFDVKKIDPAKDDPPGTIHMQLIPKPGTQFENKFKTIDFWVDPASQMPVRIQTLDRNETTTRTTELKDVKIDSKLSDKDFELPKISEGEWKITEAPYED
jgi:outer membrane lipoprotein-sorting protein